MNTPTTVLRSGVYTPHRSLLEDIEELCRGDMRVDDRVIANMLVKYFFNYLYPGSHSDKIPESEINRVFWIAQNFFKITKTEKEFETDESLYRSINDFSYQLAMLGDIAASIPVIKDIISRKIHGIVQGQYYGIDVGTGSGILLLAQFIQARRNSFTDIYNFGVEYAKKPSERTAQIAKVCGFGQVIAGDSTQPATYTGFPRNIAPLFISNENIPLPYASFYDGETIHEPFFENFVTLGSIFGTKVVNACEVFPHKISFVIEGEDGKQEIHSAGPQYVEIAQQIVKLRSTQKGRNVGIAPIGAQIGQRFFHNLEEVGENYRWYSARDTGWINFLPGWNHRWKKDISKT